MPRETKVQTNCLPEQRSPQHNWTPVGRGTDPENECWKPRRREEGRRMPVEGGRTESTGGGRPHCPDRVEGCSVGVRAHRNSTSICSNLTVHT